MKDMEIIINSQNQLDIYFKGIKISSSTIDNNNKELIKNKIKYDHNHIDIKLSIEDKGEYFEKYLSKDESYYIGVIKNLRIEKLKKDNPKLYKMIMSGKISEDEYYKKLIKKEGFDNRTARRITQYLYGLNIDISKYAKMFDGEYLDIIQDGISDAVDVDFYAKKEYSIDLMRKIFNILILRLPKEEENDLINLAILEN